jgi:hypothetical protein
MITERLSHSPLRYRSNRVFLGWRSTLSASSSLGQAKRGWRRTRHGCSDLASPGLVARCQSPTARSSNWNFLSNTGPIRSTTPHFNCPSRGSVLQVAPLRWHRSDLSRRGEPCRVSGCPIDTTLNQWRSWSAAKMASHSRRKCPIHQLDFTGAALSAYCRF